MRPRGAGAQDPRRSATIHKRPREGEGGVPCLHIGSGANFLSGRRKDLLGCGKARESTSDPRATSWIQGHERDECGRAMQLVGFGNFVRGEHAARTGHNCQTGEAVEIAAAKTAVFRW
jgi:hypothetical protein